MQTKKKSALRKGWELLLSEFHKCLLPAVPTAHYCDSWNLEPCPFPTRMWSSWQETVVELPPQRSWALPWPQLPPQGRVLSPGPGAVPRPASRLTWSLNPAEIGTSSPGAPGTGVRGSDCAQSPPRASRGTSLTDGRGQRVGLGASARPFLEHFSFPLPPHCAKCWKRQLQYYCSEAHLVPALDGLALISIAVETGASRVTSLGISYRVGFLYQLCYLLYTL